MATLFAPLTWWAQGKEDGVVAKRAKERSEEKVLWSGSSARDIAARISGGSWDGGGFEDEAEVQEQGQEERFGNMVVVKPD